ncbi:Slx4p interacting protein [Rhodotorula kratochvilovae]
MPRVRPPSPSRSSSPPASRETTSTIVNHTLAPFYACYLLRSFAPRRGGTYIGSTPNPPRRWKQHMGLVKGGAFKTRLGRPWEMEAIVHGFPTKLQALQFEWAWQNPHASRLLHRTSPGAALDPGQKPQAQFPRAALSNRPLSKVQVLMYMLTVPPWRAFGLTVTLFGEDARGWWDAARRAGPVVRTEAAQRKWEREREKSGERGDPWGERAEWIDRVRVEVRREGVDGARLVREGERTEEEALERIRVDDGEFFDAHWAKWTALDHAALQSASCTICSKPIDVSDHLSFHLCTASSPHALAPCLALFHPPCLASHFLSTPSALPRSAAPPSTAAPPLLPSGGACPACGGEMKWTDLVRGSYRRMEEVEGRRKRRTRQRGMGAATAPAARAKGKGKKRAAAVGSEEDDEEDERFGFPSDEGEDDDAPSVDLALDEGGDDDDDEEEAERSFARLDAAQGALDLDFDGALAVFEGEEIRSLWVADDDDVLHRASSKKKARKARTPSPPTPVHSSPKRRGRPPKARTPSPPAPLPPKRRGRPPKALPASPPAVVAAPAKRRGRPPKDTSAPVASTLTGAFSSTKAGLSSRAGAKGKAPRAVRAPLSSGDDDGDDALLPPSALGKPQEGASKPVRRKKVEAYVELSD